MINLDKNYYTVYPEVDEALKSGKPVVALESTVLTHGLPYPQNLTLARDLEALIRDQRCTPATIAIDQGKICIGMDPAKLEQLINEKDLLKISVRDIAPAIKKQKSGGTTVAGTLAIAHAAGIKVFATGGIGGVHRGSTHDVSADLIELTRSKLIVVCAGAKAILDIPATLELLETYSVPVIGYQTDEFPAFYSISSGAPVTVRADSAEEVVDLAKTHWDLGLPGSILLAVPVPVDAAMKSDVIESIIQTALDEMEKQHLYGQAVTPYLLRRVSELTGGDSLKANLALLQNNAQVAAEIAQLLARR